MNLNPRNLRIRYYSKSVSLEKLVHFFFSLSNLSFLKHLSFSPIFSPSEPVYTILLILCNYESLPCATFIIFSTKVGWTLKLCQPCSWLMKKPTSILNFLRSSRMCVWIVNNAAKFHAEFLLKASSHQLLRWLPKMVINS